MNAKLTQCRPPNAVEESLKADVRQMMRLDRIRLLERYPFVGHLAMYLELIPIIDCRMTTATTDGKRMFVDAEFYQKMDQEERLGILGHEVWHCALRHFQRLGNRDRRKFNIACDVEVDLLLHKDGFKVEVLPHEASREGKSAEQIYDLMFPELEQFRKDDEHIFDSDDLANMAEAKTEDKQGEKDSNVSNNENNNCLDTDAKRMKASTNNADGVSGTANLPRVSHAGVIDPDFQPELDPEFSEGWKYRLKNIIQRTEHEGKGIGSLPDNVKDLIRDIDSVATVDWKRVLLDFVSQAFGGDRQWLPPARRYVWKKLYLPNCSKKKRIEIVLAVDTSGSTTADLPDFLAELRGMAAAFGEYKLTIIQCDIAIHSVKEYSNDDPLPEDGLTFQGFGGTSFLAPFKYVEEKMSETPTVFIYLTDGYGDAPANAPAYPVIWCLTEGGEKPAQWGMEVKIRR